VTESDEVYVNAGEKGRPHRQPTDPPRRRANKRRGHGTWTTDRPPVGGVVGRTTGQIRLRVLAQSTKAELRSLGEAAPAPGSTVNTDEWRGQGWVEESGRQRQAVNHAQHEWARDDDGDGVREVHINTMEGLWTGARNFLRPFRGVSKWCLRGYMAVFEWAHNLKELTAGFVTMMIVPFTSADT
jgi:transposase